MAYDVKLGSGFRLDIVDINPVDIQQTINDASLLLLINRRISRYIM